MAKYPKDQFDDIPADLARVGAHRAHPRSGAALVTLAWSALAVVVIVAAALGGLAAFRGLGFSADSADVAPTPTAEPTAEPVTDPAAIDAARGITISIFNGTTTVGLEDTAAAALASWPVGALAPASTRDVTETIVYYSNPLDEDVARGVALALGFEQVTESTAFLGAPITVVLGADYAP
jgi:hypothetical protein